LTCLVSEGTIRQDFPASEYPENRISPQGHVMSPV
jgi:hypothetical protein